MLGRTQQVCGDEEYSIVETVGLRDPRKHQRNRKQLNSKTKLRCNDDKAKSGLGRKRRTRPVTQQSSEPDLNRGNPSQKPSRKNNNQIHKQYQQRQSSGKSSDLLHLNNDKLGATTPKSNCQRNKTLSFGTVEVREYARCLGDHPSASSDGPSLSLDWIYISRGTMSFFESI